MDYAAKFLVLHSVMSGIRDTVIVGTAENVPSTVEIYSMLNPLLDMSLDGFWNWNICYWRFSGERLLFAESFLFEWIVYIVPRWRVDDNVLGALPDHVREDCEHRMEDIEKESPRLVLTASRGSDVAKAKIQSFIALDMLSLQKS